MWTSVIVILTRLPSIQHLLDHIHERVLSQETGFFHGKRQLFLHQLGLLTPDAGPAVRMRIGDVIDRNQVISGYGVGSRRKPPALFGVEDLSHRSTPSTHHHISTA